MIYLELAMTFFDEEQILNNFVIGSKLVNELNCAVYIK